MGQAKVQCDGPVPQGDLQNVEPVLAGVHVDKLRGPDELDVRQVHPARAPDLDHVVPAVLDLLHVAVHLVVHEGEVIGHPEHKLDASGRQRIRIHGPLQALGDVHATGGLEAIVAARVLLPLVQRLQLARVLDDLLRHPGRDVRLLLRAHIHPRPVPLRPPAIRQRLRRPVLRCLRRLRRLPRLTYTARTKREEERSERREREREREREGEREKAGERERAGEGQRERETFPSAVASSGPLIATPPPAQPGTPPGAAGEGAVDAAADAPIPARRRRMPSRMTEAVQYAIQL